MDSQLFRQTQRISILFLFSFLFSTNSSTQTLHFYLVTQNSSENGSKIDKESMKALAIEIKKEVPKLTVRTKIIDASVASKVRIRRELSEAGISADDVVWYYYSGHSEVYQTWPCSNQGGVPLIWVHEILKKTPARLTLAMYDCSHQNIAFQKYPNGYRQKSKGYQILFLKSKGNLIASSGSSGKYSYGNPNHGGAFTNMFIKALRSQTNWERVMADAKDRTNSIIKGLGKNQIPIYELQNFF